MSGQFYVYKHSSGVRLIFDQSYGAQSGGQIKIGLNARNRWLQCPYSLFSNNATEVSGWAAPVRMAKKAFNTDYYYACAAWGCAGIVMETAYNSGAGYTPSTPGRSEVNFAGSLSTAYESTFSVSGPGKAYYKFDQTYRLLYDWGNSILIDGYGWNGGYTYRPIADSGSTRMTGNIAPERYNNAGLLHVGGETVTFVCTPSNELCRVKRWTINGAEVPNSAGKTEIILTMPYADAAIVCEFEQYLNYVTVKADGTPGCRIDKPQTSVMMESGQQTERITATVDEAEQVNYRFVGWYKGYGNNLAPEACTELVTTDAAVQFTAEGQDLTFVAKFASRRTTLKIGVSGQGTFEATVNNQVVATGATTYENTDTRDGWTATLNAKAAERYYFSHWLIPLGETTSQSVYANPTSFELVARAENACTAHFIEKTVVAMNLSVSGGVGQGSFSGDLSAGGIFTDKKGLTTTDTYVETEYAFTATETDKLYGFKKWQYQIGTEWFDVVAEALPGWIRQVDGDKLVVYIKGGTNGPLGLRAVFYKKTTYTIGEPTIEGDHPINKNLASGDAANTVSDLPTPDEMVGGVKRWLEQDIQLNATAGNKWEVVEIQVVFQNSGQQTFTGASASFRLTENITAIRVIYNAKQYAVSVATAAGSEAVASASGSTPTVYFEYHPITDPDGWEQATSAEVYVDTPIILHAAPLAAFADTARFQQWSLNGVGLPYTANQSDVLITGTRAFEVTFEAKHTFDIVGSVVDAGETIWFGEVEVSYVTGGTRTTATLPDADGASALEAWLTCGSSFDLEATPKTTAGTTTHTGYFSGWSESIGGMWQGISGWGTSVEAVTVGEPRTLRATFSDQEVWPILRLRNPEGGLYCAFTVSGARLERSQKIKTTGGGEEIVTLTDPNDHFCDPFSIVQVRMELYDDSTRFLRWQELAFGTVQEPGTAVEQENYSETSDLSVFMTGNLHLVPIFWTGTPILAVARLTTDSEATFGDVSLEGDFITQTSDSEATFMQDDTATFVASPRNGYRFAGWYATAAGEGEPVSTEARMAVTMSATRVYYARFTQDRNAIYTFGTGTANKTLHWRSRRVTTSVPVSFSTAQVDVEGTYDDVSLTVYHSSSPDVPYEEHTYTVKDGNSRRIKLGERAEKCFEFEVETSHPVNFMGVGTSVNALLSGGQA